MEQQQQQPEQRSGKFLSMSQDSSQVLDKSKLLYKRSKDEAEGKEVPPPVSHSAIGLDQISNPPTDEELCRLKPVKTSELPRKYKRENWARVFVNRSLRLDRIKWFGFDMDYTLAVYKAPVFESMCYDIAVKRLITMGYPETISQLKYDPEFPVRGLFLDNELGHLLKVDNFGNVLVCLHGRQKLKKSVIFELYPSGLAAKEVGKRFYLLSTLFALPEACLYADLVEHFKTNAERYKDKSLPQEIIHSYDMDVSFKNLFQDVREVMDYIHNFGEMKKRVLADISKYIQKDPRIAVLLDRLRKSGAKTFLLTNSQYHYTNSVMSYLLNDLNPTEYTDWKQYFNVIIVGAQKPSFFGSGNTLRKVDLDTGALKVSSITVDRFEPGQVYNGGSLSLFNKLVNTSPDQVLYLGDHIYADIIISKKTQGWRTLLVVRELEHELQATNSHAEKYHRLMTLEFIRAELFRDLDSKATELPDLSVLRKHMRNASNGLDAVYNKYFGPLFRSGSKQTYFSMQVQRYADLYSSDYLNLLHYPLFYTFIAAAPVMPHDYHDEIDTTTTTTSTSTGVSSAITHHHVSVHLFLCG
eukprot:TRINITY_DN201_c0_g2_i1.p1 TRINITY_DN201_c0_g2~~TRINITY_DN201_c0_g2_i1.p1  ORF type:complete len:582 (-),score=105.90 TRINITY_DN201_c0_g2_i1:104-1849(-)